MKALEYLKKEREIKKHYSEIAWGYYDKSIDEAITELEALNNRSCENCKYCSFSVSSSIRCDLFECYQQKALKYCGNWKPKND